MEGRRDQPSASRESDPRAEDPRDWDPTTWKPGDVITRPGGRYVLLSRGDSRWQVRHPDDESERTRGLYDDDAIRFGWKRVAPAPEPEQPEGERHVQRASLRPPCGGATPLPPLRPRSPDAPASAPPAGDAERDAQGLRDTIRRIGKALNKNIEQRRDASRRIRRQRREIARMNRDLAIERKQWREEADHLRSERDDARFSPIGDNHHNAARCPHCGDLLGKAESARDAATARAEAAEGKLEVAWEQRNRYRAMMLTVERERDEARAGIPYPYCPECECEIRTVDEDGCCDQCGADPINPTAEHVAELTTAEKERDEARGLLDLGTVAKINGLIMKVSRLERQRDDALKQADETTKLREVASKALDSAVAKISEMTHEVEEAKRFHREMSTQATDARAKLAEVTRERDHAREIRDEHYIDLVREKKMANDLRAKLAAAEEEIAKLKAKTPLGTYCAYCGFRVSSDPHGAEVAEHIRTCEEHPMRAVEKALAEKSDYLRLAEAANRRLRKERDGLTERIAILEKGQAGADLADLRDQLRSLATAIEFALADAPPAGDETKGRDA